MDLRKVMVDAEWVTRITVASQLIYRGFVSVNGNVVQDDNHECFPGDVVYFIGNTYNVLKDAAIMRLEFMNALFATLKVAGIEIKGGLDEGQIDTYLDVSYQGQEYVLHVCGERKKDKGYSNGHDAQLPRR